MHGSLRCFGRWCDPGFAGWALEALRLGALRRRLPSLAEKDRLEAVVAMVQEVVAAVLGLAGAAAVPSSQPLKELGLDSLMAVEIRNQLSARAETTLPATLVFDYPTPQEIATFLLREAFAEMDGAAAPPAAKAPRHASGVSATTVPQSGTPTQYSFPSRDGLTIYGHLSLPTGPGPFSGRRRSHRRPRRCAR